jgi:hypothetical protein
MRTQLRIAALALAVCTCAPQPGSARVKFRWRDGAPEGHRALYAFVDIEERAIAKEPGAIVARAEPTLLGHEVRFPSVTYGSNRVAVVAIRPSPWRNERVLYAGVSDPFSIGPGTFTELETELVRTASTSGGEAGPDPPDVAGAMLERRPWGVNGDPAPAFRLLARAGAAPPGRAVVAFDSAEVARAAVIGRETAGVDGSFSMPLGYADLKQLPQVFIAIEDGDGRLSDASEQPGLQASAVQDVSWTATMIGKIPGRAYPNPHELRAFAQTHGLLSENEAAAAAVNIEALDAEDGRALVVSTTPVWRQHVPGPSPSARGGHALAYDPVTGKTLLFGGYGEAGRSKDTWSWDGSSWTKYPDAEIHPRARNVHGLVFSGIAGGIFLFGGAELAAGFGRLNDSWVWRNDAWEERTNADDEIPPLDYYAFAYDSRRGRVVLFGGRDADNAPRAETWEHDGVRWILRTTAHAPLPRYAAAMTYDAARARTVLFGGADQRRDFGDTWEWDGDDWIDRSPAPVLSPRARGEHALSYDAERQTVLLFGGRFEGGTLDDTWEWNGDTWTLVQGTIAPSPRYWHAMSSDSARRKIVLFGGYKITGEYFADTWEWDGAEWREHTPSPDAPPPRSNASLVYHREADQMLLFGGFDGAERPLGDTWIWADRGWTEESPTLSPPPRGGQAAVYDPSRNRVLLFGGFGFTFLDDLWAWDGAAWSPIMTPARTPSARADPGLAYDPVNERALLFGGASLGPSDTIVIRNDLWIFDGTAWRELTPEEPWPAPRIRSAMVFDEARSSAIIFGGVGDDPLAPFDDTWTWDGSSWSRFGGDSSPSPRHASGAAYAVGRESMLLFGGSSSTEGATRDTWEWNGRRWSPIPVLGLLPSGRFDAGFAYDEKRDRAIVFGGSDVLLLDTTRPLGDTWILELGSEGRPGFIAAVSWAAAFATGAVLGEISIAARAGGTEGARVSVWDFVAGRWEGTLSVPAAADALERIELRLGPDIAERYIDRDQLIHVLIEPEGFGPRATVSLDYLEVSVRYRLPACDRGPPCPEN